jgi:hypothetical protein
MGVEALTNKLAAIRSSVPTFFKKPLTPLTPTSGATGKFIFMDFCQSTKVYLIIAFLSLLYMVSIEQSLFWLILKAVIFICWAFLLNKLCMSGNKAIAWVFAIIPQCIFLILTIKPSASRRPEPQAIQTVNE